ncbi:MAG: DUF3329 domain-containing protein [Rhizobiales bacterium]|nr:DUF3329 domain-containing protein [Hyphomicrobiales bacterium]
MFQVPDHPFYRPLWRRLAIIAVSGIWTATEILWSGNVLWIVIAGGFFLYALYVFLIAWKDPPAAT